MGCTCNLRNIKHSNTNNTLATDNGKLYTGGDTADTASGAKSNNSYWAKAELELTDADAAGNVDTAETVESDPTNPIYRIAYQYFLLFS